MDEHDLKIDLTDPDQIARLELVREYTTNPDFRKALEDYTWTLNQKS